MLYEYVKAFSGYNTSKNIDASDGSIDSNNISENAKEAMDWAVTQNIIKGKGNPNDTKDKLLLDPRATITRAECAQVIKNFLNPSSDPTPNFNISSKLLNNTSLGLSDDEKRTMAVVMDKMLEADFEPAFICGMLGNIAKEGNFGLFEGTTPTGHRPYMKYMVKHYDYYNKYSYKYIYNLNLNEVWQMDDELYKMGYKPDGKNAGFALGCCQWTYDRTHYLLKKYKEIAGDSDTISREQVTLAECLYMIQELENEIPIRACQKRFIYTNWEKANPDKLSSSAAYDAGKRICTQYECPENCSYKSVWGPRADMASQIYDVCFK